MCQGSWLCISWSQYSICSNVTYINLLLAQRIPGRRSMHARYCFHIYFHAARKAVGKPSGGTNSWKCLGQRPQTSLGKTTCGHQPRDEVGLWSLLYHMSLMLRFGVCLKIIKCDTHDMPTPILLWLRKPCLYLWIMYWLLTERELRQIIILEWNEIMLCVFFFNQINVCLFWYVILLQDKEPLWWNHFNSPIK